MNLSEELKWRGFVNQTTYKDLSVLDNRSIAFYHGFDASSDSLTIGNLAALMMDKLFIRHGHHAVIVSGGATSLIGDPGGKDVERPMQSVETIEANVASVQKQMEKIFGSSAQMVNNLDWTKDVKVLDFLRDVGKHFSVTPLVQRDYIAKRIGEGGAGISYAEFSYTILQGFDFLQLYKNHKVELQLAGSDQWGNCLSGVELVRRVIGKEVNVLTMPLIINKSTGRKFGKSEAGAVWLDASKTDPVTEFYQFWLNLDDEGLEEYLKIYTELSKEDIDNIIVQHIQDRAKRTGQRRLAWEVTKLVHGEDIAKQAAQYSDGLMQSDRTADSSSAIKVKSGASIVDTLVEAELSSSKTEARQLLSDGGIYIDDKSVNKDKFEKTDFHDGALRLRKGKKLNNSVLVLLEE